MDPRRAYDPVPNMINSKSVLFYDYDIGSRIVEVMALPHDRHAMYCTEKTTFEFVEKLSDSLVSVSHSHFLNKYEYKFQVQLSVTIQNSIRVSFMTKLVVTPRRCRT